MDQTGQAPRDMKRRSLFRIGTLVAAFTSASVASANAASGSPAPMNEYVPTAEKGAPSGVATLDGEARIPPAQIPDLSASYGRKTETFIDDFPRLGAETDDTPRLGRAIAAAIAPGGEKVIRFGSSTYTLNDKTTISAPEVRFIGNGLSTTLTNGNNKTMLDITGAGFQMQNMRINVSDANRTNFPITVTGGVRPLFDTIYVNGATNANRSGIHFVSGSMGTVQNSIFNHSCIRISTWDVKIDKVYIWAMSCEYGIGVFDGAGNTTLTNVDVVPPLAGTPQGRAGIYIDGASGNPFNTKMSNIYLDGNPTLDTRIGIYIGDGAGATLMENINANRMDSDCIVIDSAINVTLNGYSGHTNNDKGRGSREVFVTRTGIQAVENIRLVNIQCLRTTPVAGTAAPAIEVAPSVDGSQVSIEGFGIKQPGTGGGYAAPEVKVDATRTSLSGRGQLSKYSAQGSAAFAAGATGITINLSTPYPMAYRPLLSDISLTFDTTLPSSPRIQILSNNKIYVAWTGKTPRMGKVFWRVDLRR
ncbi:hypothetical protein ACIQC0_09875 [Pseudarthrobacter sp. NPDC092419]|uniref:hypothetical protein n=1 Tax=Pseudarthrobacter sp. NPDC092419 TaxID=3364414 RepID=UPI0037F34B91